MLRPRVPREYTSAMMIPGRPNPGEFSKHSAYARMRPSIEFFNSERVELTDELGRSADAVHQ
jgi:hypothetical protein